MFEIKPDVPVITIPDENEELLESLELLLHEIAEEEATSTAYQPDVTQEDEDITSALLDSLIKGIHDKVLFPTSL